MVRDDEAPGPVEVCGGGELVDGCDVGGDDVGGDVGVEVGGRDDVGGAELGGGVGRVVGDGRVEVGAVVVLGPEGGVPPDVGGGGGGAGSFPSLELVVADVELGGVDVDSGAGGGGSNRGASASLVAEVAEEVGELMTASGNAWSSPREPSAIAAITAKPVESRTPAPARTATRRGCASGSSRCIGSIGLPPRPFSCPFPAEPAFASRSSRERDDIRRDSESR